MAITQQKRERAFGMFAEGLATDRIARQLRLPVTSVRSMKSNWTRNHGTTPTVTNTVAFDDPVVVRLNSRRIRDAVAAGRPVQILVDLN